MGRGKEQAQRLLAIVVIIAMLLVMGIHPSVVIFFGIITYFIWRAVQHSERQDTGRIFEFYRDANEILREEERRWYGFELDKAIERGEQILHSMIDPPPLVYFALGALHNYAGDHEAAAEHLSFVIENDLSDERQRHAPSSELRRYVYVLRKLEREPAEAPQTMAAIRSLERLRRNRAATLLEESREKLSAIPAHNSKPLPHLPLSSFPQTDADMAHKVSAVRRESTPPPPPITEVLRDVYEEEKKKTA